MGDSASLNDMEPLLAKGIGISSSPSGDFDPKTGIKAEGPYCLVRPQSGQAGTPGDESALKTNGRGLSRWG